MLEFVFVLPLYLLLFGGTFLTFELSLARIHLQEANRNLAWLSGDRYDYPKEEGNGSNAEVGYITRQLHKEVRRYYDDRNSLETRISVWAGDLYGYGDQADKPGSWGGSIQAFSEGSDAARISIEVDNKGGNWLKTLLPDSNWCSLYSGNMELKMNHVSAAYIGAIASSDILHPEEDGERKFYKASYELTRAVGKDDQNSGNNNDKPLVANGEALIIHRKASCVERAEINTASLALTRMTLESWPMGEGMLESIMMETITELSDKIVDKLDAWGN